MYDTCQYCSSYQIDTKTCRFNPPVHKLGFPHADPDDWCSKWTEIPDPLVKPIKSAVGRPGYNYQLFIPIVHQVCEGEENRMVPNQLYKIFRKSIPTLGRSTFYKLTSQLVERGELHVHKDTKLYSVAKTETLNITEEQA